MAFDLKSIDFKKMCKRELNVGTKDQQIRYWVGGAALLLSVFLGNVFLLIVGVALVGSAYLRWCPAYSALSKSTAEAGGAPAEKEESAPAVAPSPEPAAPAAGTEKPAPARKPRASRAK
ncbi:MAG TPA: DUF2892 domain-containing protein [Methylococcaceae bacterium]|nr:DUF2892 domain-containing protein [Methylococcaceae bacterium]